MLKPNIDRAVNMMIAQIRLAASLGAAVNEARRQNDHQTARELLSLLQAMM